MWEWLLHNRHYQRQATVAYCGMQAAQQHGLVRRVGAIQAQ